MRKNSKYISTNIPGWFRDPKSGATLNLNAEQLLLYREKIDKIKDQRRHDEELKDLNEKINKLEEFITRSLENLKNKTIKD